MNLASRYNYCSQYLFTLLTLVNSNHLWHSITGIFSLHLECKTSTIFYTMEEKPCSSLPLHSLTVVWTSALLFVVHSYCSYCVVYILYPFLYCCHTVVLQFRNHKIHPSIHPSIATNLLFTTCPPSEPWDVTWDWAHRQPFSLPVSSDVRPPRRHGNRKNTSPTHAYTSMYWRRRLRRQTTTTCRWRSSSYGSHACLQKRLEWMCSLQCIQLSTMRSPDNPTQPCSPSASTSSLTAHSPAYL